MAVFNSEMSPSRPLDRWDPAFMVEIRGSDAAWGPIEPGGNSVMSIRSREIVFAVVALKDLCVIGWSPRI